jgi:hypothetical protein
MHSELISLNKRERNYNGHGIAPEENCRNIKEWIESNPPNWS